MHRHSILSLFLFIAGNVMSQGLHRYHPVWPNTMGYCTSSYEEYDAYLWDNGNTGAYSGDLAVGDHQVICYIGGVAVDTNQFTIEQSEWVLNQTVLGNAGETVEVDIWAEVQPYGAGGIWNDLACPPVSSSTKAILFQDGMAVDTLTNVNKVGSMKQWDNLPYGHAYHVKVVDLGPCGSYTEAPDVQTYVLDGGQFVMNVHAAANGANGSIEVLDYIPDPLALPALPAELTGNVRLAQYPSEDYIGSRPLGSALWDNLGTGYYHVYFGPSDIVATSADTVVFVDFATGFGAPRTGPDDALVVWPQPATTEIHWRAIKAGDVQVIDHRGRIVAHGPNEGKLNVSDLPSGVYVLRAGSRTARFMTMGR